MKKLAIYPGTFDPITFGHLDVIQRASELFDTVIVAVLENASKKPLFSKEERVEMIRHSIQGMTNVEVDVFDGLLVEYAKKKGAIAIIRGLRAISDFEYEFQMALMNRKISNGITTVFLMPHEKYTYLNSTIVRELARLKANVSDFVPSFVAEKLKEKFK
ncbi:MAG: pantetheine-phosphate adenylyltransferase [Ignavibacteria bacterium]